MNNVILQFLNDNPGYTLTMTTDKMSYRVLFELFKEGSFAKASISFNWIDLIAEDAKSNLDNVAKNFLEGLKINLDMTIKEHNK